MPAASLLEVARALLVDADAKTAFRDDPEGYLAAARRAAVLGAGTMGAQIAAHLANAGVRTLLLDLTVEIAREGLKRAVALKPDPF